MSDINGFADNMINRILTIIRQERLNDTRYESAIVNNVNIDGTVDVYFPPNRQKVFTKISNQTPFKLAEGDSVEILVKNGSYSNCWIVAKHGATFLQNDTK